jgi:hypothetical protein
MAVGDATTLGKITAEKSGIKLRAPPAVRHRAPLFSKIIVRLRGSAAIYNTDARTP